MGDSSLTGTLSRMFTIKQFCFSLSVLVLASLSGCSEVSAWGSPDASPELSRVDAPLSSPWDVTATPSPVLTEQPAASATASLPTPTSTPMPVPAAPSGGAEALADAPPFAVGDELTIQRFGHAKSKAATSSSSRPWPTGRIMPNTLPAMRPMGTRSTGCLRSRSVMSPEGGFPAIVFIHGYIPPSVYRTTERYVAYVDALGSQRVCRLQDRSAWVWQLGRRANRRLFFAGLHHRRHLSTQEPAETGIRGCARNRHVGA